MSGNVSLTLVCMSCPHAACIMLDLGPSSRYVASCMIWIHIHIVRYDSMMKRANGNCPQINMNAFFFFFLFFLFCAGGGVLEFEHIFCNTYIFSFIMCVLIFRFCMCFLFCNCTFIIVEIVIVLHSVSTDEYRLLCKTLIVLVLGCCCCFGIHCFNFNPVSTIACSSCKLVPKTAGLCHNQVHVQAEGT